MDHIPAGDWGHLRWAIGVACSARVAAKAEDDIGRFVWALRLLSQGTAVNPFDYGEPGLARWSILALRRGLS